MQSAFSCRTALLGAIQQLFRASWSWRKCFALADLTAGLAIVRATGPY